MYGFKKWLPSIQFCWRKTRSGWAIAATAKFNGINSLGRVRAVRYGVARAL